MEITLLPGADSIRFPLPAYEAIKIARAEHTGELFDVVAGLDRELVWQLKERSLNSTDTALAMTSDKKRFGEDSYKAWYARTRAPFALIHQKTGTLVALAWYGPKPLGEKSAESSAGAAGKKRSEAGEWHTVSFRSYPPFRGTGFMKAFSKFTLDIYAAHFPRARFWVGIESNNAASIKLAESLGFTLDEKASDPANHRLVMVRN